MFKKSVIIVCILGNVTFVSRAENKLVSPTTATLTTSSGSIIDIDCYRKTPNNAKFPIDFPVEIIIKKKNLYGYAKIIETLPPGFTATLIESQGATFSFVNQKITFVWDELPSQNELKISYMVSIGANTRGVQITEGVFYFIENDRTLKFVLPQTSISIIDPAIEQIITTAKKPISPATDTKLSANNNKPANKPKEKKKEKTTVTYTVSPTGSISYRVQFMALYEINVKEPLVFENITEPIATSLSQGFIQYTIGPFNTYEEALKHKAEMEALGYTGSFVKAYKEKKRITIKEARALQEAAFSMR